MTADVSPEDKAAIEREFFNRLTDNVQSRANLNEKAGKDPLTAYLEATVDEFTRQNRLLNGAAPTQGRAQ